MPRATRASPQAHVVDSATMETIDTIAAIATPPGVGAIAVVRVSGRLSVQIREALFVAGASNAKPRSLHSHRAIHGWIKNPADNSKVDEVLITVFLAPHSYTGEDMIEISCHGSPVLTKNILALCLAQGARLARPGEFTQRAFLSGKLDLTQAEAVLDLIQSKTGRQSQNALSALQGDLGRSIQQVRSQLLTLLTNITAGIDFPEEVGETPLPDVEYIITSALATLQALAATARSGKFLREGLRLAIVGRPNAGKSSLLNQLLKMERAIVTDTPGTTRDSLEEFVDLNGLPVVLVDTAGIRESVDAIELIGMERTKRAIEEAELVLFVIDLTRGWEGEEQCIKSMIGDKPWLLLKNKCDLKIELPQSTSNGAKGNIGQLLISAKTGEGLDQIQEQIKAWALAGLGQMDGGASVNDRQAALCDRALDSLALALSAAHSGLPQDCLATDLKDAIDRLSEICGELVSEEVIAAVFANFCIGK